MVIEGAAPMLDVRNLSAAYGQSQVLHGIDLSVGRGEIVVLVGRNGMGKSTLCQAIMGLLGSTTGSVKFGGQELVGKPPYRIARVGLGFVPQGRRLFPSLSTDEHLQIVPRNGHGSWTPKRVYETFPKLAERKRTGAGQLSGGEQQMLAIGRALMAEPKLLILDEPSLGLSPLLVEELFALIRRINGEGIALLLVEQNVVQCLEVARRAYILEKGVFVLHGNSADIRDDPNLKRAYLGL